MPDTAPDERKTMMEAMGATVVKVGLRVGIRSRVRVRDGIRVGIGVEIRFGVKVRVRVGFGSALEGSP